VVAGSEQRAAGIGARIAEREAREKNPRTTILHFPFPFPTFLLTIAYIRPNLWLVEDRNKSADTGARILPLGRKLICQ
jgi:hypothetical protein